MYKIKDAAKRGTALLGAASLLVGIGSSALPAFVSADSLNPLTKRSLTLSSSSPGWAFTDGSGNSTYAPPNSGANGKKTGNYFSFDTTSNALIKGFSFQYCTTAAGTCLSPGDDGYTNNSGVYTRNLDTTSLSDLNVTTSTPTEISSGDWTTVSGSASQVPAADDTQGNFVVLVGGAYSGGWTMNATNLEDDTVANHVGATGKNNFMTLSNSTGQTITPTTNVQVKFFATNGNYITNPGAGAFFVKINDYSDATYANYGPTDTTIVDGGVTVANVMNQSIEIQTKVLETMEFSVGTVDPDTLTDAALKTAEASANPVTHGECDPILTTMDPTNPADPTNTLTLGDTNAEDSLQTSATFASHSYWRLSSNSSAGATVYYSGSTLSNTEGDQIAAIGTTAAAPHAGTPQFGLALDNGASGVYGVNYAPAAGNGSGLNYETAADNNPTAIDASFTTDTASNGDVHNPQLSPLVPTGNSTTGVAYYGGGTGGINTVDSGGIASEYAFDPNAKTAPVPLASENNQVVDCVTGKMRYVANIAATTPAGLYTTKVNYIAAPQY